MKYQTSDKLIYNIQNENFFIHINNKFESTILKEIESINSDNKIFFVYDSHINPKIIKNLTKFLRKTGNIIITKRLKGNKSNKNRKQLFEIIDNLIKEKFTKKSILLSMGGGVVGDLSALAASLYLRGLIYFHVPTTMTSIIDSCTQKVCSLISI
jgi:3-dehydroquinate synthase